MVPELASHSFCTDRRLPSPRTRGGSMEQRTISGDASRLATARRLVLAALGTAMLAGCQQTPVSEQQTGGQQKAATPGVTSCTATLAATPKPAGPPPDRSADPASAPPAPVSTETEPTARLYMADGQLISHGLTIYVTADLHKSENVVLRLSRNHAITTATAAEAQALSPTLVAAGQEWNETFQGRTVHWKGTMLVFDTSAMSLDGRAMTRVR